MRRGARSDAATEFEVRIDGLGFRGDGIASLGSERLVVPLGLPGERWRIRRRGREPVVEPIACLEASARRATPVCRHFGTCGGCALQHLPPDLYAATKLRQIEGALAARGLAAPGPITLHQSPLASRRRLRLAFTRDGSLGYRKRGARGVVAVSECPIARPALVARFAPLRRLLAGLEAARGGAEATLTGLDQGVEAVLHLSERPDLAGYEALAAFAEAADLVRLAIAVDGAAAEPVAARRPAVLTIAGVAVNLPPAAFLQATAEAEAALQAFVLRHVGAGRRIVDLFAGVGTLALPLAERGAAIRAFDVAADLLGAVRHPRITAVRRELSRAPLSPDELAGVDAVVLDPPRAGAEAQAAALASSPVPCIVYVACDAASFARDAARLVAGGYRLTALEAVDQFVYSREIELAAAFSRATLTP